MCELGLFFRGILPCGEHSAACLDFSNETKPDEVGCRPILELA